MSFHAQLLQRAAARRRRVVLCEGNDSRVREAAERLRRDKIVEPIVLGGDGIDPADDPRLGRVAQHLRERRPDRIHDGVHALDLAALPLNFGASLVALGEADGAVAGAVCPTRETIRAALWAIGTAPGVRLVSSSFYMVLADRNVFVCGEGVVGPV
jgi:phosphate acetyltransferase